MQLPIIDSRSYKYMKILVFSDSHGKADTMCRVIEAHPAATHILFCGDGLRDVAFLEEQYPKRIFAALKSPSVLLIVLVWLVMAILNLFS